MDIRKAKAIAKSYRAEFRYDAHRRVWVLRKKDAKGNIIGRVQYLTPLELEQITPYRFEMDYIARSSETPGR